MSISNAKTRGGHARDVVILGAGLIGLATALELHDRGAAVTVVERGRSVAGASNAAAGMLAAEDPFNPAELGELARLSVERYPGFLRRVEDLSELPVPFQTERTRQYLQDGSMRVLAEHSIDPRQLGGSLLAAVRATSIRLIEGAEAVGFEDGTNIIRLADGSRIPARSVLYATGAWTAGVTSKLEDEGVAVVPRKGQMLRVRMPSANPVTEVHRSEHVYVVPRTRGPQTGTALIGATVEDAGFDTRVQPRDLDQLRALAAELVPALASSAEAPMVESWAGLRPAAPDLLPVMGESAIAGRFFATGHYRNGVLLAPATASVMSDLIEGKTPAVRISAFSPLRFAPSLAR